MKTNRISSTNFQSGIKVNCKDNKNIKYLYNEILGVTREYKIPANFQTPGITLPSVTKDVLKKLRELGIKYKEVN